ncbi:MAG: polysaccharide deacetylase family protein [Bauldia sp.]
MRNGVCAAFLAVVVAILAPPVLANEDATYPDTQFGIPERLRQLAPAPTVAPAPALTAPRQALAPAPAAPPSVRPPAGVPRLPTPAAPGQAYGYGPEPVRPSVPPTLGGLACVALTFDDGPDPNLTPRLLAVLAAEGVKATFFVLGSKTATWPNVVRAAADAGNEIGNHSWDHPPLPSLGDDAVRRQIANTDAAIQRAIGSTPRVLRPPYGSISPRVRALDSRPWVLWYTDTQDWRTHNGNTTINVASATPTGSIVLMHDTQPSTVNAAEGLIRNLKGRGFKFVTVSEMLAGACGSYPARQVSL